MLELTLASVILLMGLWLSFQLFEWGSRAFVLVHLRSGLQGEARRMAVAVESDLRRSDLQMVEVVDATTDPSRRVTSALEQESGVREAICFPTLSRWDDPACVDRANCQPLWDRYTVLYATREDLGRLVKQNYQPAGAPYTGPFGSLGLLLGDNPALNPGAQVPLVLSNSVLSFGVAMDPDRAQVSLNLTLAGSGSLKAGRRRTRERYQSKFTYRLENTPP